MIATFISRVKRRGQEHIETQKSSIVSRVKRRGQVAPIATKHILLYLLVWEQVMVTVAVLNNVLLESMQ